METKLVNIWNLEGRLICGGLMNQDTLLDKVAEHDGNVEHAKELWNTATPLAGPDWCRSVRVRVVDV